MLDDLAKVMNKEKSMYKTQNSGAFASNAGTWYSKCIHVVLCYDGRESELAASSSSTVDQSLDSLLDSL